jgi:DNA-binding CsgD family transcriptional regulator
MKTFLRILLYGLVLGALLTAMSWAKYRLLIADHATELYVLLVAGLFTGLGIWAGLRWTAPGWIAPKRSEPLPATTAPEPVFSLQQPAAERLAQLGISAREGEVLACLAQGLTNDQIADRLFVSTNTVKTHLANLYAKLDVSRRTQALEKARRLGLLA